MKKYLEIYPKTWKNHGNIMEFCQTKKVGTLLLTQTFCTIFTNITNDVRYTGNNLFILQILPN